MQNNVLLGVRDRYLKRDLPQRYEAAPRFKKPRVYSTFVAIAQLAEAVAASRARQAFKQEKPAL